jgi:hypothetical protein
VSASSIGIIVAATIGECLFVFTVLRYAVKFIVKRQDALSEGGDVKNFAGTFLFLCLCLLICCLLTNVIGLSFMIGAFQMGMIIPRTSDLAHKIEEKTFVDRYSSGEKGNHATSPPGIAGESLTNYEWKLRKRMSYGYFIRADSCKRKSIFFEMRIAPNRMTPGMGRKMGKCQSLSSDLRVH